jgi:hypothetical protein
MTISRDVMLAILSMDSYNRGYGQGVGGLPASGRLGEVTIRSREADGIGDPTFASWQAAGFYAIAYDVSQAGISGLSGTVISYRGTDNVNPLSSGQDLTTGWLVGGGAQWGQAPLAIA